MEVVVAAGDNDFFPVCRQFPHRRRFEKVVRWILQQLRSRDGRNLLWEGLVQNLDMPNKSKRLEEVVPFFLREPWGLSRLTLHEFIRPKLHVKRPVAGGFVKPPQISEKEIVKSARNDIGHCSFTLTSNDPGTTSSDTTYRYPPPQPEYIAPG